VSRTRSSPPLPDRRIPRLGLRFLLATVVGLVAAGSGILVVVERTLASQAEHQAVDHAKTTASIILDRRLRPADLTRRLSPERRRLLLSWIAPSKLGVNAVGARLVSASGTTVVGSTTAAPPARALLARAEEGNAVSSVTSTSSGRVLRTLLPVRLGVDARGVLEVDQDYERIAAAARRSSYVVGAILEALLLGLCVLLLPTLARATGRLRRLVEQLDHLASHDELTGLLNRAGFRRRLGEEMSGQGAVVLVDVDRFRELNEAIGPEEADTVLAELAQRLRSAFPDRPLARLGDDEFAIVLPTTSSSEVVEAAAIVSGVFAETLPVDGIRIAIDVHVGIARFPEHGDDVETLLGHASMALTHAKIDVERVAVYDEHHGRNDLARLALVAEIRQALRSGQIVVHYQPQVSLLSGRVRGVEALVRWQHPERGLLAAGEFIEVAEQSAVISELGRHVLATSIRQWGRWRDEGLDLDLAVNLGTVDLLDVTLPSAIVELLVEEQMPADRLVLEITERTLLGGETKSNRVLRQLERIGVSLAVDDYGTGYSSLATLRALPVKQLKIDRCFVAGLPDDRTSDKIIDSTVKLAHALDATVVAEGVETEAQLRRLTLLGCDFAQGYLPGRPQSAQQLGVAMRRRNASHPATPIAPTKLAVVRD
jgi:diguanylate cyclase (GGDEF)-like protein